jgi:hypothetical protein
MARCSGEELWSRSKVLVGPINMSRFGHSPDGIEVASDVGSREGEDNREVPGASAFPTAPDPKEEGSMQSLPTGDAAAARVLG